MKKILILLICSCFYINAQSIKAKRSVSSSTSVQAESNSYKINGTVGQNAIGLSNKDQVKISSGYWGWIARWAVLGMDYEKLVVPMVKAIQELTARIEKLENQLEANGIDVSASQ